MNAQQSGHTGKAEPSGMWSQPQALLEWLLQQGVDACPPLTISRVGIGQSNITTVVSDGVGAQWVMREPPAGATPDSGHDIHCETGIVQALFDSDVPVPRVIGTGKSPSGSPFLMMDRVAGAALETEQDALLLSPKQRLDLGVSLPHTLGRLHSLDPAVLKIRASSSPYLARQIRRVAAAWDRVRTASRFDGEWRAVCTQLTGQLPTDTQAVIMHGDYRLSNLLVAQGRINAVLDWELCTIGDPLADLAWLLDDWRPADERAIAMPSPTRAGGFSTVTR